MQVSKGFQQKGNVSLPAAFNARVRLFMCVPVRERVCVCVCASVYVLMVDEVVSDSTLLLSPLFSQQTWPVAPGDSLVTPRVCMYLCVYLCVHWKMRTHTHTHSDTDRLTVTLIHRCSFTVRSCTRRLQGLLLMRTIIALIVTIVMMMLVSSRISKKRMMMMMMMMTMVMMMMMMMSTVKRERDEIGRETKEEKEKVLSLCLLPTLRCPTNEFGSSWQKQLNWPHLAIVTCIDVQSFNWFLLLLLLLLPSFLSSGHLSQSCD